MPGQNAFAFNGTAFVPTDRNLTAGISVFSPAPTRKGVSYVHTLADGAPATQVWEGYPPQPSAPTYRNIRTGSLPNRQNSLWVDWTCDTSSLISTFTIFGRVGASGAYSVVGTVAANVREFNYGYLDADTTYYFYVRANGINGLNSTGDPSNTSLASPSAPTNLRETSTSSSSITWTWDFTADTYQRFHIYRYNGSSYVYNTEVIPTISATSATHSWTGLSENSTYYIRVYGQNYNGHWSSNIDDGATTGNAAPAAPTISVSKVSVASSPAVRTSTSSTQTRSFTVTVDPWDDPLFSEVFLEVSSDNANWTEIKTWADNTNSKTHTHSVSTTTAITRYYRARQKDSAGLYSGWTSSVSATSDAIWSVTDTSTSYSGSGTVGNDWIQGQNLGVTSWAVTSTFNNDAQTYGGDQAFDGDSTKAWRSASTTNARIRITFPISGNWVNGISGIEFWPAQAYNTYVELSSDGGATWLGDSYAPGTGNAYVEYKAAANISPNTLNTIDINPDRYVYNKTAGVDSPGNASVSWAVRLEFQSTTARTFEVNQINVKQLRQNAQTNTSSTTYYW